jgi:hypothetical protein
MATTINRAALTAKVDDDGSNTTGSLVNKAFFTTVVMDPIDAAFVTLDAADATKLTIAPRVNGTTSSATPTPNADTTDLYSLTAQAAAAAFANPTGTPANGQQLLIRIKDNGTARALTWGTAYVEGSGSLPATTVLSKILTLTFRYNTDNALNKWQCLAVAQESAAAAGGSGAWTVATASTLTGAQNNWAPTGLSGNTYIPWNGASDVAFTGLAGGVSGQLVTVKNITAAKTATFAHNSGSSSAGNKFKNFATSGATPIAPGGTITYQYDGTDWQLIAHEQGMPVSVAYVAGNFTAAGAMTWTVDSGDLLLFSYFLRGRLLTVFFTIESSSVGGTPSSALLVAIPGGFTAANQSRSTNLYYGDNGTNADGTIRTSAAGVTVLELAKANQSTWTASTNNTNVYSSFVFEVQ